MMFHYFLQDQSGILRIGYIASESLESAKKLLERASIRELMSIRAVSEENTPTGARYMYPFEGTWKKEDIKGTVEGETLLSALAHLHKEFEGSIAYIAERPPKNPGERALFTKQTEAFLQTFEPKRAPETIAKTEEPQNVSAVATVLDRQMNELFEDVVLRTKDLLRERQYADEMKEMHSIMYSAQKRKNLDLKEKYDTLSYILRELSYVEDGLDPSPIKKDMRFLIDQVVNFLKKVEKSMVRTAFHVDNVRLSDEDDNMPIEPEQQKIAVEEPLSRYASRRLLVAEIMVGIQSLTSGSLAMSTSAGTIDLPGAGIQSANIPSNEEASEEDSIAHAHREAETPVEQPKRTTLPVDHTHASEPLSHIFLREIPLFLEWFTGFSILTIIAGQVTAAMQSPPIIMGYNLAEALSPFALQPIFLKTTLIALLALIGLRTYQSFDHRPALQWLSSIVVIISGVLTFFVM